jgi:CHAT domain-containing protein
VTLLQQTWQRRWSVCLPAVLVAIAAACGGTRRDDSQAADLDAIVRALRPRVAMPGRLSDLSYQAARSDKIIGTGTGTSLPINAATRVKTAASSGDPVALRFAAGFALVTGQPQAAAALLTEALVAHRADAASLSDLAAVYLSLAEIEPEDRRTEWLARAVDAAAAATAADNDAPAAWFNLALALERIGLTDQAVEAWHRVTTCERDAAWLAEEREHVAALAPRRTARNWRAAQPALVLAAAQGDVNSIRQIVDAFRQPAREYVEEDLLATWARAQLARDRAAAGTALASLRSITTALAETTGDHLLSTLIASLANAAGSDASRDAIARGCLAFADGRRAYEANQLEEAGRQFVAAREALVSVHSVFALVADHGLAMVEYQRRQFAAAQTRLEAVVAAATASRFVSMQARATLVLGIVRLARGDLEAALEKYDAALRQFERIGEHENVANAANTAADTLRLLGQHATGWTDIGKALHGLDALRSARRRYVLLLNASLYAAEDDLPAAALVFQNASIAAAQERDVPNTLAEAYTRRARLYLATGQLTRARADLDTANSIVASIESATSRAYQTGWLNAVRGEYLLATHSPEAIGALDLAIGYFPRAEAAEMPRLYLRRGQAALALGNDGEAESAFRTGLDLLEQRRRALSATAHRMSYLDEGWTLFDEMIHLYGVRRHQSGQAFALAESARGRELEPLPLSPRTDDAPTPEAIQRVLPADTVVVYYACLERELLIWVIGRDRATFTIVERPAKSEEAQVTAYRRLLETGRPHAELVPLATALYEQMLRPALRDVPHGQTVVIVPDGVLHAVPFGTLIDRRTGEYAVQQYNFGVAPSAKAFLRSSERLRLPADEHSTLLAVGNAHPAAGQGLPDLPEARRELSEIAALYPRATMLRDAEATAEAFARTAPAAGIIHFAGHARVNLYYPDLSQLLLAPSAANPRGVVEAREVRRWSLTSSRLVVLAACESAYGSLYRGEGLVSLARPFLQAGVASVVGSLWDVDDHATRLLLTDFHRRYVSSRDPVRSLHDAQVALLTADEASLREPAMWGAFTVVSGVAASR